MLNLKKNIKIVEINKFDGKLLDEEEVRSVIGGYLVQETSIGQSNRRGISLWSRKKDQVKGSLKTLFFMENSKTCKIECYRCWKNFCVTGIGAYQTNRVGSVKLALDNSKTLEKKSQKIKNL